jgi:hypothetical protein
MPTDNELDDLFLSQSPQIRKAAIANVLRAHGHRVVCTDLIDYGADSTAIYGVDFLKTTEVPADVACILTNPPFKLINKFIDHAAPTVSKRHHACAPGAVGIGTPVIGPGRKWAKTDIHLSQAAADDASARLEWPQGQQRHGLRLVRLGARLPRPADRPAY